MDTCYVVHWGLPDMEGQALEPVSLILAIFNIGFAVASVDFAAAHSGIHLPKLSINMPNAVEISASAARLFRHLES